MSAYSPASGESANVDLVSGGYAAKPGESLDIFFVSPSTTTSSSGLFTDRGFPRGVERGVA